MKPPPEMSVGANKAGFVGNKSVEIRQ